MLRNVQFVLTKMCNLRCTFCYLNEHTAKPEPDEVARNLATFAWIVAQYKAGLWNHYNCDGTQPAGKHLEIMFFGGEPTCAWDSIVAVVKAGAESGLSIRFFMTTNMVLMTQERIDWCIANKVNVFPSIDGCREAQDTFRRTANGQPVADVVYEHARYLIKRGRGKAVRSTLTPETAKWAFKSVEFLCDEMGFTTCHQVTSAGGEWTTAAIETLKEQTALTTDWWIGHMRAGRHYDLYYLMNMLGGIWNPVRRKKGCSAGITHGSIDTAGRIVPCNMFCNASTPPEYVMGSIHHGGVTSQNVEAVLKAFDLGGFHKEKCCRCPAVNSCNFLCLHEAMLSGCGTFAIPSYYCQLVPFYHAEAMRAHATLTAERNDMYLRLYKPGHNKTPLCQFTLAPK